MKSMLLPLLLALAFLLACTTGCQPGGHQRFYNSAKQDLKELPANLWEDSKNYVSNTENLVILLGAGAASGATRCAYDDDVEHHFDTHGNSFPRDLTIAMGAIPIAELSLSGIGYLAGTWNEDDELYQVSRAMLEAQALNGIYTVMLKAAVWDESPNGEAPAWPSGHTSIATTFATVLNEFYGPLVGIPLYGLAGFVGYERMQTGEHWASDIVFGAAIGYTVGKTVASKYKPEIFGMDVQPFLDPVNGSAGFALSKRF